MATALVLSALGVPRDVILADYHLSTQDRRPENEMPHIDPARYPGNVVAAYYVKAQASGKPTKPRPLYDASGVALLQQCEIGGQRFWRRGVRAVLGGDDEDAQG